MKPSDPMCQWVLPNWPGPLRVRAFTTTRAGGVSEQAWAGMNLGAHVGDDPLKVQENRQLLKQWGRLPNEPVWLQQVHGTAVARLDCKSRPGICADAAVTTETGVVCAVLTADCLPVLFCDRAGSRVAVAHAGWRGLAGGVLEATAAALETPPQDVLAWLGPAIGPRAFEVGGEVREAFLGHSPDAACAFRPSPGGRWLADLYALARLRLTALGIDAVYGGGLCTHSDPARFFSYRRDGATGRMATLIWLHDISNEHEV